MNKTVLISFALFFFMISACFEEECGKYRYTSQFKYKVDPSQVTPKGISVDLTGQDVSLETIDRLTDEVENCLKETFGDPPVIPEDVQRDGQCISSTFTLPIDRSCLVVKVPDDWEISCTGGFQVLPRKSTAYISDQPCLDKGLTPTTQCLCRWRAGIQDNHILVVTPNLYLYKDPMIRLATGCNNPWGHPALENCFYSSKKQGN